MLWLMISLITTSLLVCSVSVASSFSVGLGLGEQSPFPSYETSALESQSQSKHWATTQRLLAIAPAPAPALGGDDDDDNSNSNSNSDSNSSEQVEPSSLVLAPRRTYRKDPLNHSNRYTGGWNISNRHYWAVSSLNLTSCTRHNLHETTSSCAILSYSLILIQVSLQSVGYTAVPFFAIAAVWFIVFGLCLSLICLCYCCFPREPYGYSRIAYALSLIFLVCFTIAAMYSFSLVNALLLYSCFVTAQLISDRPYIP